ncbi:hypothetical protein T439DRAFT_321650 [Meredithblackwellia eburnea MCA 4105]
MDADFATALLAKTSVKDQGADPGSTEGQQPKQKTQLRKPSRTEHACVACRRRKVKCSGETPSCARCVRLNKLPCIYEAPKLGPPKTYAESLERRIDAMESVLRELALGAGVDLSELLDTAEDDEKTEALEQAVEILEERRRLESTSSPPVPSPPPPRPVDVDLGLVRNRTIDADLQSTTIGGWRYAGPSSGPLFGRKVISSLMPQTIPFGQQDAAGPSLVDNILLEELTSRSKSFPLPPPDLSKSLIDAYFEYINTLLPILHRPSFERALEAGLAEKDPSFRRLLFGVFALGCRFVDDSRIPIHELLVNMDPASTGHVRGFAYFRSATGEYASHLVAPTLFDIQGSVLSVLWTMGGTTPIICWLRVGMSIRQAVDVGCHVEHRSRWNLSPLEDQLRKRAFHTLLIFDCFLSVHTGRPLAMKEHDMNLNLPIDVTDEELDEWNLRGSEAPPPDSPAAPTALLPWLHLVKLMRISGTALQSLYSAQTHDISIKEISCNVVKLDSMLNNWMTNVPDFLRWNPETLDPKWFAGSAMLHSMWYFTQILIHRDFVVRGSKEGVLSPLPSLAICANAARSASHLADAVRKERKSMEQMFWFIVQQTAIAGAILTYVCVRQGKKSLTGSIPMAIKRCLAIPREMAGSTYMGLHITNKAASGKHSELLAQIFDVAPLYEQDPAGSPLPPKVPFPRLRTESAPASVGPTPASQPSGPLAGDMDDDSILRNVELQTMLNSSAGAAPMSVDLSTDYLQSLIDQVAALDELPGFDPAYSDSSFTSESEGAMDFFDFKMLDIDWGPSLSTRDAFNFVPTGYNTAI